MYTVYGNELRRQTMRTMKGKWDRGDHANEGDEGAGKPKIILA